MFMAGAVASRGRVLKTTFEINYSNVPYDGCDCYGSWDYSNETYRRDETPDWDAGWCYVQAGTDMWRYQDSKRIECNMTLNFYGCGFVFSMEYQLVICSGRDGMWLVQRCTCAQRDSGSGLGAQLRHSMKFIWMRGDS